MSTRGKRRSRSGSESAKGGSKGSEKNKKSKKGIIFLISGAVVVALALVTIIGVYSYIRSYLNGDDFTEDMEIVVSDTLKGDVSLSPISWSGWTAKADRLTLVEGKGEVSELEIDDITLDVKIKEAFDGVWRVTSVHAKELDYYNDLTRQTDRYVKKGQKKEGFISDMLPDETVIDSFNVDAFNAEWKTSGGSYKLEEVKVAVTPSRDFSKYDISLTSGDIKLPNQVLSRVSLHSAELVFEDKELVVEEAKIHGFKEAEIDLSGRVKGGDFAFDLDVRDVYLNELIDDSWSRKVKGLASTRCKVIDTPSADGGYSVIGKLEIEDASLSSLPILNTLASYTNKLEFRNIEFDKCEADYVYTPQAISLKNIRLHSGQLVRVEGDLKIMGDQLDGNLEVGLSPGTLAHIPGAETLVFKKGKDNLLWTSLRLTGTVGSPEEDLSNRMIAAAGERILEMVPETGQKIFKLTGEKFNDALTGKGPAGDILNQGVETLKTGGGILGVLGTNSREKPASDKTVIQPKDEKQILYKKYLSTLTSRWERKADWNALTSSDKEHCAVGSKFDGEFAKGYVFTLLASSKDLSEKHTAFQGKEATFLSPIGFTTKSGLKGYSLKASFETPAKGFDRKWVQYDIYLDIGDSLSLCYRLECKSSDFSFAKSGFERWVRSTQLVNENQVEKEDVEEKSDGLLDPLKKGLDVLPINPF